MCVNVCGISAIFAEVCLCQRQFLRVTYFGLTVQTVNRKEKDDANSYPHRWWWYDRICGWCLQNNTKTELPHDIKHYFCPARRGTSTWTRTRSGPLATAAKTWLFFPSPCRTTLPVCCWPSKRYKAQFTIKSLFLDCSFWIAFYSNENQSSLDWGFLDLNFWGNINGVSDWYFPLTILNKICLSYHSVRARCTLGKSPVHHRADT